MACNHAFGSCAPWPRKCFICGADEMEVLGAAKMDRIIETAQRQLREQKEQLTREIIERKQNDPRD